MNLVMMVQAEIWNRDERGKLVMFVNLHTLSAYGVYIQDPWTNNLSIIASPGPMACSNPLLRNVSPV